MDYQFVSLDEERLLYKGEHLSARKSSGVAYMKTPKDTDKCPVVTQQVCISP